MTPWFTSDLHLGHSSILEFTDRRKDYIYVDDGSEIEVHDEWVISSINSHVKPEDTLYILGDVSFHKKWKTGSLVESIQGKKHLILGNHDEKLSDFYRTSGLFLSVNTRLEIKYNHKRIILDHYPLAEWSAGHHGSYHCHGHTHGNFDYAKANLQDKRILDVGFDNAYKLFGVHRPFSFEDVEKLFEDRVSIQHHGKSD